MLHEANAIIPWWRVQYTEADAKSAAQAIRNEHISLGPLTALFEEKLAEKLNVPYVVATTSGSTALVMALLALGIGPGDEVIVPNRTWIAAAHAVKLVGAEVVLVDVLSDIPIIDTKAIENKISQKTKAIIPTALSGRAVNIHVIKKIAERHGLWVIEDAAQAFFSREEGQYMGTQTEIGCFSLSLAKLLPTGQGGFVTTRNKSLYQELRKIRTHGVEDLLQCSFQRFGFNFRFTDLQASLGLSQLAQVETKIDALKQIYQQYESGLKSCRKVKLIPIALSREELPLYIEICCSQREQLVPFLESRQIQVKRFYPNLNKALYLNSTDEFPHAHVFEVEGLTLPCGPDQSRGNIDRVINAIMEYDAI